ncbi:carboxymuconolactone decarboxylase family domain-containing protein [Trichoderma breve]|uniref:Carboxymuconolactone decarboxylase family domain-containing protein n=1 Tax=Trichoderma breve TaxID=2034170 RepID=A0A9W9BD69_9HYPO|nr:carboxymuconolactone decarboxylase family domain-containing protein [Trichoderma breve]KAJ4860279.1 carboxymuconolactone decarboxylase family domain-containing protein [Trichoderma breve]
MRLPYVADPPPVQTEQDAAIVQRIRDPDGWNSFLGAVRTKTSLTDDVRELAISRVAVCNKAWYEWGHHAPLAIKGGVSEDAMETVKRDSLGERPEGLLSEKQWAALVYADEMTKNVQVADETFAALKQHFNDQEVVEITATVAAYNCVSRFLVALDVGEKNGTGPGALSAH